MALPESHRPAELLEASLGDPRDPRSPLSFAAAVEHDEREAFPQPQVDALLSRGYARAMVPRTLGGELDSLETAALMQRAISRRDLTCAIALGQSFLGSIPIWLAGDEAQQARAARLLLSGGAMGLALTEEEHGSDVLAGDAHAIETTGHLEPPRWRITGRKWLINNGARGAAYTVFARTGQPNALDGHSLFFVERDRLSAGSMRSLGKIRTHGIRGADISGLVLDGAGPLEDPLLGAKGGGLELLLKSLQITRAGCAFFSLGAADTALRLALDFARERTLYGGKLIDLPQARAELSQVFAELLLAESAALATVRAAQVAPEQLSLWSAAIKFFVPVLCERSIRACARVLGARHYLREGFAGGVFQKLLRDAEVVSLFDGSTAVNLDGVGTQLLRLAGRARPGSREERDAALEQIFAVGAPVPPLDGAKLVLLNGGRCDLTQGLADARAALGAARPPALLAAIDRLLAAHSRLLDDVRQLQQRERSEVKRSPELFELARRFCAIFAGACAAQMSLRAPLARVATGDGLLAAALERAVSLAASAELESPLALAPELRGALADRMLELHAEEKSFSLFPLQLGSGAGR